MSKRCIELHLSDIQEAIEKIESYTQDFKKFKNDPKTINAVIRNL